MSALEMYLSNKGGDIDIAAELRYQIVYLFRSIFSIFNLFINVYFLLETGGAEAPPPALQRPRLHRPCAINNYKGNNTKQKLGGKTLCELSNFPNEFLRNLLFGISSSNIV